MTEPTSLPAETKLSYGGVSMEQVGGGSMLVAKTYGEVVAFATVMSRADIALPKHLRGNDGACMAVTMQALRWEMDPFAVANKTYLVNDRLAYEAQLVAAVVITRAPIVGRPVYVYSGAGPTRSCNVSITMKNGQILDYDTPQTKDIKVQNSPLWKSDLDQQLGYFAIRSWARRHTPEVILGVYTPEEVAEFRDVTPQKTGIAETLAQQGSASGPGFSREGVTQGLEEIVEAEFSELMGDDLPPGLRGLAETLEAGALDLNADPPTPEELVAKVIDTPPDVEPEVDPLDIDIEAATLDQRAAWVVALQASIMRGKTAAGSMAVWTQYFESHIKPLHRVDVGLYDKLHAWMDARMKRLREQEKAAVKS